MQDSFQTRDAVLGLAVIAAAIMWAGVTIYTKPAAPPRYAIVYGGEPRLLYRLDTSTGSMWMCRGLDCMEMPRRAIPTYADVVVPHTLPRSVGARVRD